MNHKTVIVTEEEALVLIEDELRRRHVSQRSQGIVRLPRMLAKPEPPADFWTRPEAAMGAPLRVPVQDAVDRLRRMMRAKRVGQTLPGDDDGERE